MELIFKNNKIILDNKEFTVLDKLVTDFVSRITVKYVIISGYTAILFGRSRNTEDIDIFIEKLDYGAFSKFYNKIVFSRRYECINAENSKSAYEMLMEKSSIRFAEPGTYEPNFEIKFPQNELSLYSLQKAVVVKLNKKHEIRIGPMELQLAYKLYLGSEKDYLDASHLYEIFKDYIDRQELKSLIKKLGIKTGVAKMILGEKI